MGSEMCIRDRSHPTHQSDPKTAIAAIASWTPELSKPSPPNPRMMRIAAWESVNGRIMDRASDARISIILMICSSFMVIPFGWI